MSGSAAQSYDWSRFVKRVNIKADPKMIYEALTTRGGLEGWFLRKALLFSINNHLKQERESVTKGDRYEWYWHGWGDDAVERGQFLEANGKDIAGQLCFRHGATCYEYNRCYDLDWIRENVGTALLW